MRTNIDIDDELLAEAMAALGQQSKKATVTAALEQAVRSHRRRKALEAIAGSGWDAPEWEDETVELI